MVQCMHDLHAALAGLAKHFIEEFQPGVFLNASSCFPCFLRQGLYFKSLQVKEKHSVMMNAFQWPQETLLSFHLVHLVFPVI